MSFQFTHSNTFLTTLLYFALAFDQTNRKYQFDAHPKLLERMLLLNTKHVITESAVQVQLKFGVTAAGSHVPAHGTVSIYLKSACKAAAACIPSNTDGLNCIPEHKYVFVLDPAMHLCSAAYLLSGHRGSRSR